MGKLTTHVLDIANGRPASGMLIELFCPVSGNRLAKGLTNHDGRLIDPLLSGSSFAMGEYELRFHVGEYFESKGVDLPGPRFLGIVPVRFHIGESVNYHVPLLVSPYGFSTYRGS